MPSLKPRQRKVSVPVTKDIMKIKSIFNDEDFLEELTFVVKDVYTTEVQRAAGMIELLQPLESTVVPKFVTFLAKKTCLLALKPICQEYVSALHIVRFAQRLSKSQIETIKEKMKAKTSAMDIQLITEVDAGPLGGFVIDHGFTDPKSLDTPSEGVDFSLKSVLEKAALDQDVVTSV